MQTVWIIVIVVAAILLVVGGVLIYRKESYAASAPSHAPQASSEKELVLFSSPGCPHCRNLAPAWQQVAEALKGKLKVTEIGPGDPRMVQHKVPGVPCIRLYESGMNGPFVEYKGDRSKESILEFALRS